jgi:hypothetical protein
MLRRLYDICIKNRRAGAYFTVETAMIIPVVLVTIVIIIHMAFMLYATCLLSNDSFLLALRGGIASADNPQKYVESNASAQFGNLYLGSNVPKVKSVNVDDSGKEIRVNLGTETFHEWTRYGSIGYTGSWKSSASWKVYYTKPFDRIRLMTRLTDLGRSGIAHLKGKKE